KWGGYRSPKPKAAVLPGLSVDATWDHADEFTNWVFTRAKPQYYQGMFNIDPENPVTQYDLASMRLMACSEIEGRCPEGLLKLVLGSIMTGAIAGGGERSAARLGTRGNGREANPCHSFLPNTEVALASGKRKRIEDIKTGDKVIATDPETGKTTTRAVVATIVTKDDKHFTDLTVQTPSGDSSIIATDTHPFWSVDKKKWINAGDLRPGAELRTPKGAVVKVVAVRHFDKQQQTHDLTVEGTHTYYVLAGETPVLVHNSGGCPDLDALSKSGMRPAKGKTTHAGREYQKHMNRGDLPVVPGKELKTAGQDLLDDILTNPQTSTSAVNSGNFAGGTRYIMPDPAGGRGIGATFDANGQFQYFGRY
ncbi:polymorphic toxin-type HINT domain-containing protein, partial [Streptomyces sp. NPDC056405]